MKKAYFSKDLSHHRFKSSWSAILNKRNLARYVNNPYFFKVKTSVQNHKYNFVLTNQIYIIFYKRLLLLTQIFFKGHKFLSSTISPFLRSVTTISCKFVKAFPAFATN